MDFDSPPLTQTTTTTRLSAPLKVDKPTAPPRNGKKKLTTDQIVAITILLFVLVGVLFMSLALAGVFNRTPPQVSLTPSVTFGPETTLVSTVPIVP